MRNPWLVLVVCVSCAALPRLARGARSGGLTPQSVNASRGPVGSRSPPAAVARLQILLDRSGTSPGAIDGKWGANTAKAVEAFQAREGLRVTGEVDADTARVLARRAGGGEAITAVKLSSDEVEGPFVEIPDDVHARAEMECLCYTSLAEKLAERFHTTPEFLAKLSGGRDLDRLTTGDELHVPAVDRRDPAGEIARLVVHKEGGYLRALDDGGDLVLHFPITVGAEFSQSPDGTYVIEAIARAPTWHYQPTSSANNAGAQRDAYLPPGPNNPVGAVWIALSKPSFGIHGTDAPETIGYASSSGCVRLTNWDALFLAAHVRKDLPVDFVE